MKCLLMFLFCCLLATAAQAVTVSSGLVHWGESGNNSPMLGVAEGRLSADWSKDGAVSHAGVGVGFPVYVVQGAKIRAQVGAGTAWDDWDLWLPELFLGLTAGVQHEGVGFFAGVRRYEYGGEFESALSYSVGVSVNLSK